MTLRPTLSPLLLCLVCCATSSTPKPAQATAPLTPPAPGIVVAQAGLAPEPPAGLRLPASVKPLAQRVELTVVPSSETFTGTTDLDVQLASATDVVWLNIRALSVQKASVSVGGAELDAQLSTAPERIALRFAHPVGPGPATLHLAFSGVISGTEDSGIFHQQEGGNWYAMTQFEETDARRAFPCVDEPSAKISWELTLHVPQALVAVSNTPIASEEPATDGTKRVRFARTKPLPSYLVAFGVGPYDIVEARPAGANKVPMRVYVPKGRGAEAAYAARTSPEILEALEAYFGIPYPYEKLDLLTIPLTVHFGAMENAGLVTVASSALLARKENETLAFERNWAVYAAHEFAHQWFGDFVTLDWWTDIWLNEAFASWMENKTVNDWAPKWGMQMVEVSDRSRAAGQDTLVSARSIRQPIESYDDIANAFDDITYAKGAAVIRMFELYLGPAKFQAGVHTYLKTHAYGTANAADFLSAISAATGQDVTPAFSTFLDQSGVPELSVQLSCSPGKQAALELTQERLLPVGTTGAAPRLWQLPVCVRWSTAGKGHEACTLMKGSTAAFPLEGKGCPDWVLPNARYAGYYRLNLKGNLLPTLVKRARVALSAAETVGLLGDVEALDTAGRAPQGQGMELATRFAAAKERQVVEEALHLADVRFDYLEGAAAKAYSQWVLRTFGARARALGMEPRPGEDEDTRLLRPPLVRFVAIRGGDNQLIAAAQAMTQRWLKDPTSVNGEMVGTALAISGTFADAALHSTLVSRLTSSPDRATRTRLVRALSRVRDPALVTANLELYKAAPIDARELDGLLFGASAWPGSRAQAFDMVRENFDLLAARMPGRAAAFLFFSAADFCDAKHRAEAAAAFEPKVEKTLGGKRDLAQVLESIDLCIANRAVQVPSITAYLTHPPR